MERQWQLRATQPGAIAVLGISAENSDIVSLADPTLSAHDDNYQPRRTQENPEENLVVAIHVSDLDDDNCITVTAKEFDPNSNPPWYRHQRIHMYCTFVTALVVGYLVVLLSLQYVPSTKKGETSPPTTAPTTYRESIGIKEQIELIISSKKLNDETSPYCKAVQWMLHDDPLQLDPFDPLLIQRYVLVFIYFSTTQIRPWKSCNPSKSNSNLSEDMICFGEVIDGIIPSIRWLSATSEMSMAWCVLWWIKSYNWYWHW